MKRFISAALLGTVVGIALSGCTVGPDYARPAVDAPAAWRIDYPKAADVANIKWWEAFGDPVLNTLIETALRENRDIRIAAARVDQFVGALVSTRSQFFPQLGYSADANRFRSSREGIPPIPAPADNYFTLYQGSLGASWQIDLFGRVRRLSEAAQAQVYASEQAQRGVVLTVVTSVATSYIVMRAFDRQLEIAQATAANFGETQRIFDLRYKHGIVSQTELSQIDSQYQQALAAIPAIGQQIAAQENLISILLGRNPGPIERGKTINQLVAPLIPADLPSTLLLRRPDILQAEQNLVAANANIGAAKALYYPTLNLTAALGSASTAFGNFLSGPASLWALGAGLAGPIFTFGAIEGQVKSAQAGEQQATQFYQQVILNAFRETNNALVGSRNKLDESSKQAQRVVSLRESARLSRLRFDNGLASYVEVLVADNELFAAELAYVSTVADRYTQLINVYQAMGGGWVDVADSLTARPQGMSAVRAPCTVTRPGRSLRSLPPRGMRSVAWDGTARKLPDAMHETIPGARVGRHSCGHHWLGSLYRQGRVRSGGVQRSRRLRDRRSHAPPAENSGHWPFTAKARPVCAVRGCHRCGHHRRGLSDRHVHGHPAAARTAVSGGAAGRHSARRHFPAYRDRADVGDVASGCPGADRYPEARRVGVRLGDDARGQRGLHVSLRELPAARAAFACRQARQPDERPPQRHAHPASRGNINARVGSYLALKTLLSILLGAISWVIMAFFGLQFAVFWAVLIGLLNYIPYLGSFLGVLLPAAMAIVQFGGIDGIVLMLLLLTVAQFLIGNFLDPYVMGNSLNLSPFAILLSLTVWSALWGIAGAFLAVPITAILAIVFSEFAGTRPIAVLLSRSGRL